MNVGIGRPAAVPEVDARTIGERGPEAEPAGFASVRVFDRLVYDNLEPLTALAAAAARTEQVELLTAVLTVSWRDNPVLPSEADRLRRPALGRTPDDGPRPGWLA